MSNLQRIIGAATLALLAWAPAAAQDAVRTMDPAGAPATAEQAAPADASQAASAGVAEAAPAGGESTAQGEHAAIGTLPEIVIQHLRPADSRGVNVFETPKNDDVPFTGFRLDWSAAFTQQFQALDHSNEAAPNLSPTGSDLNQLMDIGWGFNTAAANLGLNVQVAPGIRVALTTYLSSRHHNEAWVKDGYILVDESPLDIALLDRAMEYLTVKVGHFEIDYGDAHYRRSDNGNAMHNPFVGNLIMDAFTTQVGGHVYFRNDMGLIAMAGVTGGEIKGEVRLPEQRSPAYLAKLGFDRQLGDDLRIRLMGSYVTQDRALNNTLYSGDRAGSRYFLVLENSAASTSAQAWSGNLNPGFSNSVSAFMLNPFVEIGDLEVFGTFERASGRSDAETVDREWTQYAGDVVYRLFNDDAYVAGRYNMVQGELPGLTDEVGIDRFQFGAGWFLTPTVLLKGEWVSQSYNDFPTSDIRSGGSFDGFVMEGVIAF